MTDENNPYISNLSVDSDVNSVILIVIFPDFVNRTWTPDSFRQWGSGFLELYSRFQSQRFIIWPQAKISRISQFLGSRSRDSDP